MSFHSTPARAALLAALLAAAPAARAQWPEEPAAPPRPAAPVASTVEGLSQDQLATFARMVRQPEGAVTERLLADAALRGQAARAVAAREARRAAGKGRAVAGFVILGVGDLVGAVVSLTAKKNPDGTTADTGQLFLGAGIGLASIGVGLAIAIPGLRDMNREGPEERQAVKAYWATPAAPVPAVERPAPGAGRAVSLPLFAGSF